MLPLVLVVASLPPIPGQPLRLLGGEILAPGTASLAALVHSEHAYLRGLAPVPQAIAGSTPPPLPSVTSADRGDHEKVADREQS
jgi:hypothetical protein